MDKDGSRTGSDLIAVSDLVRLLECGMVWFGFEEGTDHEQVI